MALFKITKKNNCHTFKIRNSRALGGTSRVVLELKPFGISIRGLIGSEPWVGRSTGKMSRNSIGHCVVKKLETQGMLPIDFDID